MLNVGVCFRLFLDINPVVRWSEIYITFYHRINNLFTVALIISFSLDALESPSAPFIKIFGRFKAIIFHRLLRSNSIENINKPVVDIIIDSNVIFPPSVLQYETAPNRSRGTDFRS